MNSKKMLCGLIALLSFGSFAETFVWQGPSQDVISSGAWGTAGNWLVGGEPATRLPGEADTVHFVGAKNPTVTFDADCTVTEIDIPNNDANKPRVTLDLGGHELSVTNAIRIKKTWDYSLGLVITNGLVTTDAFSCGIDAATQWDWGAGQIIVQGANTELSISNSLDVIGKYSGLSVSQGARVSCGKLQGSTGQAGGRATITGAGSQFTVRKDFRMRDYFAMTVSDGGKVVASQPSGRVMIGNIRAGGHGTVMKVDGGTFEVPQADVTIGDCDTATVYDNRLILTNGAVMTVGAKVVLGTGHLNAKLRNNTLSILDGSTLTGAATSEIWAHGINRGQNYYSRENTIEVGDSTVSVMRMRVGNQGPKPTSSNNVLRVSGPRTKIALSGTTADAFTLRMGSELHMTIPADGFNETPIQIPNGGATVLDDSANGTKDVAFVLDADAYSRKHKGEPMTLVECGLDSTASLRHLADRVEFVNTPEERRGKLKIVDGKKLVYTPRSPSLVIFVH